MVKFSQFAYIALLKTLWFNLRYFPIREGLKFPVLIARGVYVRCCNRGFCDFMGGKNRHAEIWIR